MVHYRRSQITGGTYFFTLTLKNRSACYLTDYIDVLRGAMNKVKQAHPYKNKAFVILPDHIHAIWELSANDSNYALRWRLIKRYFTQKLIKEKIILQKNMRNEYNIWQSRFWEHLIRNNADYRAHVDYIHINPVKHGLVTKVIDWPYSSFHEYVRQGMLSSDWGGEVPKIIVRE